MDLHKTAQFVSTSPLVSLALCFYPCLMDSKPATRWTVFCGEIPVAHGVCLWQAVKVGNERLRKGQRLTHAVLRNRAYPFTKKVRVTL